MTSSHCHECSTITTRGCKCLEGTSRGTDYPRAFRTKGIPPCHVTSKADHVTIKEVEKCEYVVTFEKVYNNENNVVINHCSNSFNLNNNMQTSDHDIYMKN